MYSEAQMEQEYYRLGRAEGENAVEGGTYSWKIGATEDAKYLGTRNVGDFSNLEGATVEEVLFRIPSDATRRELIPEVGKVTEGFEYKWVQDGKTYRVRVHGPDASAPSGSNAANGWVVRVQQGKKYGPYFFAISATRNYKYIKSEL